MSIASVDLASGGFRVLVTSVIEGRRRLEAREFAATANGKCAASGRHFELALGSETYTEQLAIWWTRARYDDACYGLLIEVTR